ncbi:MFS transporter [Pseudomonas syringae pv. actinidiae]|uniref:MFS family permease n=4 Tax=Pseudomonas syringae group TaxID=136849 RepID=A0A0K8M6G0_PSESF|nr:MFS transporter [Pseudomonas syringae]EPN55452.1 MFS transporter, phthalate permease family protein [Pseudomonas syringae pv. actinidiae ICMP 19079]EPN86545.1 MFS transporter, phthalate permease family protein [Pseudomonas syringae pv. actinidiae ICMP 19101]OZI84713.1 MFS transporter [Pseudomonas avellanae]AKT28721.1 glucarate transporter [Pseudomonas syringae pv. actinidiae ICMP 18884]AOE55247.1 glucarate transporter [Pseudomonas syringae pv. actinidiae ICMP 18708]
MQKSKPTHVRYLILLMLFLVTTINYADRATIAIAGSSIQKDLGITAVTLGYIFSAFGWAYVAGQIPGGWLLDRFGSKKVYAMSIFTWSLFTLLQGYVGEFGISTAIVALFMLRFLVGLAEAPSFPGNARIVAAWFPTAERGTASAIFNSAQYFATVLFAPLMGWIVYTYGWKHVFVVMGAVGIVFSMIWMKVIYGPRNHPMINEAEFEHISSNGALVDLDQDKGKGKEKAASSGPKWDYIRQLLTNRMMLGIYLSQYCINGITYFFLTWFPVYLVQERGMTILKAGIIASLPAICGFIGGVLGGIISDYLLRKGHSLTFARKAPIIGGLLLSTSIVTCNYVDVEWVVVGFMALAFFGKGVGALGWAVMSDVSPKQIAGLSGGLFNTFGNVASITTPIVIGYIISSTGSFKWALVFVGANALLAVISYIFIVGEIKRVELKEPPAKGPLLNDSVSDLSEAKS